MERVIKKSDVLVEMVKAFEANDEKKSDEISRLIRKVLNDESKEQRYKEYIKLDRKTKKLFPPNKRLALKKGPVRKNRKIMIRLKDNQYRIVWGKNQRISFQKVIS